MAEKEERIWIEYDIPKPKGAVEATRCTTMTRSEAIEKMAKAMFEATSTTKATRTRKVAEAALNALLEDK